MKYILPLLLLAAFAPAQSSSQGVAADWDIAPTIDALSKQAERLKPILDQLTPQDWVSKGAPQTYVTQWKGAEDELKYLVDSAGAFKKQPERLTLALDTYFRLQALTQRLDSLVDGVRNYQNPAVGDLLVGVLADNSSNRDKLRQYITDLAATKEQEFEIADKEAQRCRATLNRLPARKNQ